MDLSETPSQDSAPDPTLPTQPGEAAAPPPDLIEPPLLEKPKPAPAPFIFHGDATEYFRIWIVNTLLSVLTLGLFTAWAKVRKRRYLRGNTELLGHRFDYTADPRRILVGNLIVLTLFLAYGLFGVVYPAVRYLALGVIVIFLPWIVVRSLSFNAHHTVWRGLRFRFHPSLSAAAMVYLFQPVLIVVTLGFYYPAWIRARNEFSISRHRLGTAYFRFTANTGPFYLAYLAAAAMVFAGFMAIVVTMAFVTNGNSGHLPNTTQLLPAVLLYGATLYVAKHFVFASLFNHVWNGTQLDEHRFRGHMRIGQWLKLQLTNLGAIVATCGLLYPWALIRSTRYAQSCLEFIPAGPLDAITRLGEGDGSAVGDTAAEFTSLDFGL